MHRGGECIWRRWLKINVFFFFDTKQNGGSCVFADDLSLAAVPDYFGVCHDNYLEEVLMW